MTLWQAIILAIIEGLTEFLPVSSTGHMIIGAALMGINEQSFTKLFEVNIQFGAILAVVVLYRKKFLDLTNFSFFLKLLVAFIPAAVFGKLLNDYIDALLENVMVVAINLVIGGIILLFIDKWFAHTSQDDTEKLTYRQALTIGFFQCIAMLPGVSRSAATIIGGQIQGLTRKAAAEFSFFLAVPTMFAAGAYKLLKTYDQIQKTDIQLLIIGNVVAFVVAMLAIHFFINFLTRYGFKVFGYYRIVVGLLILLLLALGIDLKV
jgi:undecaprenyl-diphosphatase